MRIPFSRSSVLTAVTIAIIVPVLPGAIRRMVQSGDPYLFTERFLEDMWARLTCRGRVRLRLQPTAATLVGVRDGKRDSLAAALLLGPGDCGSAFHTWDSSESNCHLAGSGDGSQSLHTTARSGGCEAMIIKLLSVVGKHARVRHLTPTYPYRQPPLEDL